MKFYLAAGLMVLGLLAGCSNSSTHGTEKELDVVVNINNSGGGDVNITSPLTLDSASETAQDTANTATTTPTTRLQLTEGGAAAVGDATGGISGVKGKLENVLDSFNTTKTVTTTTTYKDNEDNVVKGEKIGEEVATETEETSEDLDYAKAVSYTSYGKRNGDRYAWRIPKKGPEFGQQIKIVFSPSGKTYTIKDTSKNCRGADPDKCDIPSSSNSDGFVFKPGLGPNGDGDTNTGTSHNGVYLQGPNGDPSTKATFYYNPPK